MRFSVQGNALRQFSVHACSMHDANRSSEVCSSLDTYICCTGEVLNPDLRICSIDCSWSSCCFNCWLGQFRGMCWRVQAIPSGIFSRHWRRLPCQLLNGPKKGVWLGLHRCQTILAVGRQTLLCRILSRQHLQAT